MLVTYDRYMREFRAKQTQAKYERPVEPAKDYTICSASLLVILARKHMKDTVRNMEGQ